MNFCIILEPKLLGGWGGNGFDWRSRNSRQCLVPLRSLSQVREKYVRILDKCLHIIVGNIIESNITVCHVTSVTELEIPHTHLLFVLERSLIIFRYFPEIKKTKVVL